MAKPTLQLDTSYILEAVDRKHRSRQYLEKKLREWNHTIKNSTFFDWLDAKNEKSPQVHYLDETERKQHELLFSSGRLVNHQGYLADTSKCAEKRPGWAAYVVKDGVFYITEYSKDLRHHSSIFGDAIIDDAGMIRIENGKVTGISNSSGHYKPTADTLKTSVDLLKEKGAFKVNATVIVCSHHLKKDWWQEETLTLDKFCQKYDEGYWQQKRRSFLDNTRSFYRSISYFFKHKVYQSSIINTSDEPPLHTQDIHVQTIQPWWSILNKFTLFGARPTYEQDPNQPIHDFRFPRY